jgi:hypothetical protein
MANYRNQEKCHAEPCAELDSVLFQHLVLSIRSDPEIARS